MLFQRQARLSWCWLEPHVPFPFRQSSRTLRFLAWIRCLPFRLVELAGSPYRVSSGLSLDANVTPAGRVR
jgi:hypothetical protein